MTDAAIETHETTETRTKCPGCGAKAKRVSSITLRSLLQDDVVGPMDEPGRSSCCDANNLEATGCDAISEDTGWRFCDSPGCDVVYFSEQDDTQFTKSQLKVEVGVKETSGERPLCYCFGHSVETMKRELQETGTCTALEDIRAKMKNPGCRCETENPSGSCCLGSVAKGLKVAQLELNMSDGDDPPPPAASGAASSGPTTGRGEKIATAGTLISAIMASSCCWLPLVLLAVGVSGAGIASTLEAYRPLFITVTFGFLGAAFYFTYRPKKGAVGSGDCCAPPAADSNDCCATESATATDCCTPKAGRSFSMTTLNRAMLWGVTVLAVAFLFFPSYVGAFLGGDGSTVTEDMNRAVIKLAGMTCEACAATIAKAIREVPGMLAAEVDYRKAEAVVGTEFCCAFPKDEVLAAITEAGFEAQITEELPAQSHLTDVETGQR